MGGVYLRRVDAAHHPVKRLALDRRVGGDIELFRPSPPRPVRRPGEQFPPGAMPPAVGRNVDGGEVEVLVFTAERGRLDRDKPFQLPVQKRPADKPAGPDGVPEAPDEEGAILLRPVVDKRVGSDHPFPVFPPEAVPHHLAAVKGGKEGAGDLFF